MIPVLRESGKRRPESKSPTGNGDSLIREAQEDT